MRSILIVDDDTLVRHVFSLTLKHADYEVTAASNGIEGLRFAGETTFDGILMDVNMPHASGVEICERMVAQDRSGQVPIIFLMTGLWTPDIESQGLAAGARAVLAKPFNCEFLIRRLEAAWAERALSGRTGHGFPTIAGRALSSP